MKQTSLLSASATESGKHAYPNPQPLRTVLYVMVFILHPLHSILNRHKTFLIGLLMCLNASFQLEAQVLNVSWTPGYPAFSNPYIGILSEDDSLKLRFTINTNNASGEASKTRLVRLVLPTGVTVVSAANGGNVSGSITTGAIAQSGTTWNIPINSISYNTEVNLVVMLKAGDCSSPTGSYSTTTFILSDEAVLDGSSKTIPLNVVKPNIIAVPQVTSPVMSALNDPFTYNIPLSVSNNVSAKSMRITITKDQFTELSEFKLGSKTVTSDASSTATSVVLNLAEDIVGSTPISAAHPQTLQFTAKANVGGSRSISATYIYPQSGTTCESNKSLFSLTLSYPSVPGIAVVESGGSSWVYNHPSTGAVVNKAYDGVTTNWMQHKFTNTGNAPIGRFTMRTHRSTRYHCIDETGTIYYRIGEAPAPVKTVNKPYVYSDPLATHYDNTMLTKPSLVGKPQQVTYSIEEEVPANTTVYLWVPALRVTYDNTPWGTPPAGINTIYNPVNQQLVGYINGTLTAYDLNGNTVSVAGSGSFGGGYDWSPVFTSLLGKEQIKPEADKWVDVPIYFNTINPANNYNYSSTLHIQLPEWMELYNDGSNLSNSVKRKDNGNNLATGTVSHNAETNTYSLTVRSTGSISGDISIRYKGKPNSGYTVNQTDTIRYWIDWDTGYGLSEGSAQRNARPEIAYHAKNIQQVEYLVNLDGITLNSFALERISRGLKVRTGSTVNLRTPDDGSPAAFSVIDNEMYLQGDTGRIVLQGQTAGSSYEYLYVLINSTYRSYFRFAGLSQTNSNTRATVYVENGGSSVTIDDATIVESGANCYLRFRNTGKFPAGKNVTVTVPFVASTNTPPRAKAPVKIDVYLSDKVITDPHNPSSADRHGQEFVSGKFGTHNRAGGLDQSYNNTAVSINSGTTRIFTGYIRTASNNAGYDYPNEYRPYMHPTTMTVTIPAGYIAGDFVIRRYDSYPDESSRIKVSQNIPPPSNSTVNPDGSITYIYDVASVYDFTANTFAEATVAGNAGKWIAPDDAVYYYDSLYLTSTPLAPSLGIVKTTLKYKILPDYTEEVSQNTVSTSVSYNGARGELTVPAGTTTVYDYSVTIPSVTAAIVSSSITGTRASWLYVEGNIRDVSLQTASSATLSATAVSGNRGYWIALGNLTVGTPASYQLNYTHNSMKAAGDSVRVYLVADFNSADWSPTTSASLNVNDTEHLGGSKWIVTRPSTNSVIQGSIAVPSTKIAYGVPYDVTLSVDSRAGEADLINPEITLTVPVDQISGSYQYEYPAGSGWQTIPEEAISYPSSNQITLKSSGFGSGDFILYGSRVNVTDAERTLNVRISFSADCNTILNGFYYTASFAGKNLVNGYVSGINNLISAMINTNVESNYYFSTDLNFTTGLSFGGDSKENVLQVTVNKWTGELFDIFDTDSLIIMLPEWLDVNGPITTTSNLLPGLNNQPVAPADIVNEERSEYRRRISIKLPAAVLNNAAQKAKDRPFTYHIPLAYTEDAQDEYLREHPVQTVRTDVYTVIQFAPAEECFEGSVYSLGNASTNVALLTLKTPNPYLYNMLSLGENCDLEITSDGFEGSWYSNASLQGDPLSATSSYSFTPTVPGTKDLYVSAIFSGMDYGKIYLPLKIPPIELYWRKTGAGAGSSVEWLNPENWEVTLNGNDNTEGYLPALSTVVTLPSKADWYPVLMDTVACHIIRFEHGASLIRQDLLVYDSARVQLNVEANRWYMFSPPLHNMYSGDFYNTTPNPFAASEQQTTYTMLYNANNPETSSYQSGTWTGVFNTPNRPIYPGSGIAFWVDKHSAIYYTDHPEISFAFPKNDVAHYLYNPLRPAENDANISSPPMPTDRPQNGRFIYENSNGQIAADGNVTLQDMAGNTSGSILVGNPFMAHLDFFAFYQSNSVALNNRNQFKLASGVNEGSNGAVNTIYSYLKNPDNLGYISTELGTLETSGLIPPMQAFIVDVTGANVRANISHTTIALAEVDSFRSITSTVQSPILQILAGRGVPVSKALVLQGAAYSTNYLPSEDSYKLFVSGMNPDPETSLDVLKPVQVYTRSSDGYALDINCIGTGEQDITIPLCVRTSEKGEITLNFSGMESFGESTGIYLYDAQHPERLIDLKTQPEYVFDKTEDELYLENRLSLVIGKALQPLGIETASESSGVRVLSLSQHKLKIVSESGNALGNVRITDVWGRIVLDNPAVSSLVYEYQTPTPGIYVVHVGAAVKKVISIR